ncbi:hypothetical protein BOVMAS19_18300 [Streptococcus uberis]|uniref:helix-turn-helix transcriptional regulator n=1 Tax=Streptococcus uberis TaxID=1349 RepID=UPI0021500F9B|nr:helix-turn-helix domain-containing protein [Streptococcus uberis]MCR4253704.1 helix-turn-helix domain-containing protein [Streptococcus uberis]MCR4255699.1 helix-turn-helix domain-containing protein [Streptococcus uberis]MCR4260156.1 helix-turn-helix domain-containing protein [Streptococcus uberis]MCR4262363.1 helix-turn-helix domain-containing protein [Streptococcus uberis]
MENSILSLSEEIEKQLILRCDNILNSAIDKAVLNIDENKPIVRMSELGKYLSVSNTTIIKWQRMGLPHFVINGVTLFDKSEVRAWLNQFKR